MKLKKILKKLDNKTDWILPFYFQIIHVLGLILGGILIANIFIILIPSIEIYKFVVFGVLFLLLFAFSWEITTKHFRRGITISISIILGTSFIAYILSKIVLNYMSVK